MKCQTSALKNVTYADTHKHTRAPLLLQTCECPCVRAVRFVWELSSMFSSVVRKLFIVTHRIYTYYSRTHIVVLHVFKIKFNILCSLCHHFLIYFYCLSLQNILCNKTNKNKKIHRNCIAIAQQSKSGARAERKERRRKNISSTMNRINHQWQWRW